MSTPTKAPGGELYHQAVVIRHDDDFLRTLYRCRCGEHFQAHELAHHRLYAEVQRLRWELEQRGATDYETVHGEVVRDDFLRPEPARS